MSGRADVHRRLPTSMGDGLPNPLARKVTTMIRITLSVLILLLLTSGAPAQTERGPDGERPVSHADEEIVAWFKGDPVTRAELEPDPRTVEMNRKAWDEVNFERWKQNAAGENLSQLIMGALLMEYRETEGIEPTAEEIERFVKAVSKSREESNAEFRVQLEEFRKRLGEEELSEPERETLQQRIETLESLLSMEAERKEFERSHWGEDYEKQQRRSHETVARQMIAAWKLNQSLYERYGGRVIFQQAGPEPVDAYRKFLEEHREAGTFRIVDQELREQFWRYYVHDPMHSFYDEEDGEKLMQTPWWEMEAPLGSP